MGKRPRNGAASASRIPKNAPAQIAALSASTGTAWPLSIRPTIQGVLRTKMQYMGRMFIRPGWYSSRALVPRVRSGSVMKDMPSTAAAVLSEPNL